MRSLTALFPALFLGACMGSGEPPMAAQQAPTQAAPVTAVSQSALPPPAGQAPAGQGAPGGQGSMAQMQVATMRTAPGARESAALSNVSRSSSGASSAGGGALGGTIVGGQSASVIPSTVDRSGREPPRRASTAPRDWMGPGTAPPIIAPELRDQTGNSLRNRQRVEF